IFSALAKRAYRRPVTDEDVAELMQYYADGAKQGGFESGIRAGVTGMLASPFFLYRGERVPAGLKPGEKYAVTDLELASRRSCSRMPPAVWIRARISAASSRYSPTAFSVKTAAWWICCGGAIRT